MSYSGPDRVPSIESARLRAVFLKDGGQIAMSVLDHGGSLGLGFTAKDGKRTAFRVPADDLRTFADVLKAYADEVVR